MSPFGLAVVGCAETCFLAVGAEPLLVCFVLITFLANKTGGKYKHANPPRAEKKA